jgi:hypothetical protein
MPIHYERDDAHQRVAVTARGPFTAVDFLAIIEWRRAEGTSGYGMLYDLSGMTGEPSTADLQAFMHAAAQTTRPRGPIAVVATDPMIYWRACTYAVLGRTMALVIEAFRDQDKAEAWLTAQGGAH